MPRWSGPMAILLAAAPAAATQYETLTNPPDPAAQLAEMIDIYNATCLTAFPDDAAVARVMAARGAQPMTRDQIRIRLHDDPGRGWRIVGRTASFDVTIEDPPFHACGLRAMANAPFPDKGPYDALARRFEAGRGFNPIGTQSMEIRGLTVSGGGERRTNADGSTESLMTILTTPSGKDPAFRAVEIRFVHQFSSRD